MTESIADKRRRALARAQAMQFSPAEKRSLDRFRHELELEKQRESTLPEPLEPGTPQVGQRALLTGRQHDLPHGTLLRGRVRDPETGEFLKEDRPIGGPSYHPRSPGFRDEELQPIPQDPGWMSHDPLRVRAPRTIHLQQASLEPEISGHVFLDGRIVGRIG